MSVLPDTTGIQLSLNAVAGKQPFSVNSAVQVNRLNAQYVGGKSAAQLQTTGGVGMTSPGVDIKLPVGVSTTVASTGALPAGTYYVSATALLFTGVPSKVDAPVTSSTVYCRILGAPTNWGGGGGGVGSSYVQAAETTVVTVPADTILSEGCYANGSQQFAYDAAITAIRIDSSTTGTKPALVNRNAVVVPPKS